MSDEPLKSEAPASAAAAVTAEDVASIVSSWTGIPLSKLTADEAKAMLGFEDELHKRVVGQEGADILIAWRLPTHPMHPCRHAA